MSLKLPIPAPPAAKKKPKPAAHRRRTACPSVPRSAPPGK
jgi:hypothetical protein